MEIQKSRIGQFFLLIGIILCVVYYASYQSNSPDGRLLAVGIVSGGLGIFLILRSLKPPPPPERFRGVRKWRQKRAEKRQAREEKKKAKEKK